jgi:hypothetical protein
MSLSAAVATYSAKKCRRKSATCRLSQGKKTFGWSQYQRAICLMGYNNGYLYPLLFVEHFDDPLNEQNLAFTVHAEISKISFGDKNFTLDRKKALAWYIRDARRVESGASLKELGLPISAR